MGIEKGQRFNEEDIYIDYPFEEVMFRWDHSIKKVFHKFYGKDEIEQPIEQSNKLLNEALLFGDEISEEQYFQGK
ncbi:hypothetical protein [Neisseria sp. Ec49-e6-T10]|uniref:hypothetical protein n=1 Tax=Neisseria sp. Ec49-e6-T10 TaxID=3140744 RepID=UPI003EBB2DD9